MFSRLVFGFLIGVSAPNIAFGADPVNALAFENGAVLRAYTDEFGDRDTPEWIALALIDGNPEIGWASAKDAAFPHDFVFELGSDYELSAIQFDSRNTEEGDFPGISAAELTVSVSESGDEGSFKSIYSGTISPADITKIDLDSPVLARWIRLSITGNGGRSDYTELMEFSALGIPVASRRGKLVLSASYDTNWNQFYLIVEDGELRGCYDHDHGNFSGYVAGQFLNIEWHEDEDQFGKAVLAITEDGSFINGFWYEDGKLQGTWYGPRSESDTQPKCAEALLASSKSGVEESLDNTGRAVLYGIYFDFDSDKIRPESDQTLEQVLRWLSANPDASVVFEGFTDSDGSDAYNQTLSANRAASVVNWMATNGIAVSRLASLGYGENRPVADNTTAQGRALNRRVEIRRQ